MEDRQPVHTVYGGAHLFKADSCRRLGELALGALRRGAPEPTVLAEALGLSMDLSNQVYIRVEEKLKREAVEDFRIDFEDGYGARPDAEEDTAALAAAHEVVEGLRRAVLPPFLGIRIKALSPESRKRGLRTLELFLRALAGRKRRLPPWFCVTLPKIGSPAEVALLDKTLSKLESSLKLPRRSVKVELMVETPAALVAPDGRVALRGLVAAAGGRCAGAHLGPYDLTASLGVTSAHQRLGHPACDFARHLMQAALAGTGVFLSDGPTALLPLGPHKPKDGAELTPAQRRENQAALHLGWKAHFDDARRSLEAGFYQGWDLHPAQLPSRYAAVYSFFLEGLEPAAARLRRFVEAAARATAHGGVFDDAATGQGLLNYFLRGLACGALTPSEAARAGLTREELETRSFLKILEGRRKAAGTR